MSDASLAVIVVSYNVRGLLAACLRATIDGLAAAGAGPTSIIVVDNASADGSAAMVAERFPQVQLIASPQNLGFAGGNNLALRRLGFGEPEEQRSSGAEGRGSSGAEGQESGRAGPSTGSGAAEGSATLDTQYVLLLNPDAEPIGDAIGQMADFLAAHPTVGGVGARLQYGDGRFQHGAFRFPDLWQLWFDVFPPRPRRLLETRLNGRYAPALYDAGRPFPIDFALGAALMIRAEAVRAVGLLDEGYFMYAEEVDWCWRMMRSGWPVFCVPAARVTHHGGASTRQFRSQSFVNLWRSRKRLYDRFYPPHRRWLAGQIVRLGMWAEARRAQTAARRGEISSDECAQRIAAVREVAHSFG